MENGSATASACPAPKELADFAGGNLSGNALQRLKRRSRIAGPQSGGTSIGSELPRRRRVTWLLVQDSAE